jgi:hypothetical protein
VAFADPDPGENTMNAITHTHEGVLVPLVTFFVAISVMGSFGGLAPLELLLAIVQAVAASQLWTRYVASPASS